MVRHGLNVLALSLLLTAPSFAADKPATPPPELPKPSFDCTRAKGRVVLMICGDYDLAALDVQEAALLHRARTKAAAPDAVNADQDVWLGQRDACTSVPCVARAYRRRMQDLRQWTN